MSTNIPELVERIGRDLQTLENALKDSREVQIKIKFPHGVLRTALHFREQYRFIRSKTLQRNIAYTLILSDVYRWMLNRIDLKGTAREMLIKEGVCLMGNLAESVSKDALSGICGKNAKYKARIKKLHELRVIDDKLKSDLDWLWECRNREHLFLVEECEYGHYKLEHYNKAILTIRALRDNLDKYFRESQEL